MTYPLAMPSRPWWFYAGLLACAAVLTIAAVKHLRYIYRINSTDMIVDTWTGVACDVTTCQRVGALLDSADSRLAKSPALPGFIGDTVARR